MEIKKDLFQKKWAKITAAVSADKRLLAIPAAVLALVILAVILAFPRVSQVDALLNKIDARQYSQAASYYSNRVSGSEEDGFYEAFSSAMDKRYEDILDAYNNSEALAASSASSVGYSDDEMNQLIELLSLIIDSDNLTTFTANYKALSASKDAYATGVSCYRSEDYPGACEALGQVIQQDCFYTEAAALLADSRERVLSDLSSAVDEALSSGSYAEACAALDEQQALLASDETYLALWSTLSDSLLETTAATVNAFLKDADYANASKTLAAFVSTYSGYEELNDLFSSKTYTRLADALQSDVVPNVKDQLQEYYKSYDYEGAVSYIATAAATYPTNSDILSLQENLDSNYASYLVKAAETYIGKKKYNKAAYVLEVGKSQLGADNAALLELAGEYADVLPVYLNNLTPSSASGTVNADTVLTDSSGKTHLHSLTVDGIGQEEFSAEYALDGAYSTLTGVCAACETQATDAGTQSFSIYGDGKLLYTSPEMTGEQEPESFTVELSGVKTLKIVYAASEGSNALATIFDALLSR